MLPSSPANERATYLLRNAAMAVVAAAIFLGMAITMLIVKTLMLLGILPSPEKDLDWHVFRESGADLMRRRLLGRWEYRAMTDEEHARYIADRR